MFTILLIIIYISFISLGLPDSILGSAWPSMYGELNVPIAAAGIISMIISGGTIISSFFSDRLIKKVGTGMVTAVSVGMTAAALFGFSAAHSFMMLCIWAIPYGLGAGSVDAALNNFVALHYKSRHMSWLHCFWGVGATLGPYIMGLCLADGFKWNGGYHFVAIIQIVLTAILICSLPLWKRDQLSMPQEVAAGESLRLGKLLQVAGAKPVLAAFFCYCALETTTGLWGSSYMVMSRGMDTQASAKWISLFYLGITAGRFLSGFITSKWGDKKMVRLGQGMALLGVITLLIPFDNRTVLVGLIFIGLGCAPIYPSMLHATPDNFGVGLSQAIMGVQMACAYIGSTFMPPLFGLLAENISIKLYPFFLLIFVLVMIAMTEKLNRLTKGDQREGSR